MFGQPLFWNLFFILVGYQKKLATGKANHFVVRSAVAFDRDQSFLGMASNQRAVRASSFQVTSGRGAPPDAAGAYPGRIRSIQLFLFGSCSHMQMSVIRLLMNILYCHAYHKGIEINQMVNYKQRHVQ